MQKSTNSKINPLNTPKSGFISQDKVSFSNSEDSFYVREQSSVSAPKPTPARRGRKKLSSGDPFEDLNYNWEKGDYVDDHFESLPASRTKKSSLDDADDDQPYYTDSYTEMDEI
jgi:hypothetical protein